MTGFHSGPTGEFEQPRKRVSVIAARGAVRPSLLDWLERVYPVCFELEGSGDPRTVDGVLVLDGARLDEAPRHLPRLVLAAAARRAPSSTVALADDGRLARPLRRRKIAEHMRVGELALTPQSPRDVLARVGERVVWWQGEDGLHCSLYPLAELSDGQTLRDHLCPGCFMGVLPLLHFLASLLGDDGWTLPAPRAAFVIDDPNLHWPSYGFLKYGELASHALRHGYHLAFATVPLDGWRVDARAVATIRENPAALSLLIHGNDHVACELARLSEDRQAEAAMAQALRRVAALERRCGLHVARVMAPPHGVCSEAALRAMFRLGFEAICISRPYPWRDGLPPPSPLAGWYPTELVAGGIPVAPRQALSAPREDLAFRALLGQPLILHGHHGDFADGLDLLEQAAADINDLGEVRWGPLDRVAGGAHATLAFDEDAARAHVWAARVDRDPGGSRHAARPCPGAARRGRLAGRELQRGPGTHELRRRNRCVCDAGRAGRRDHSIWSWWPNVRSTLRGLGRLAGGPGRLPDGAGRGARPVAAVASPLLRGPAHTSSIGQWAFNAHEPSHAARAPAADTPAATGRRLCGCQRPDYVPAPPIGSLQLAACLCPVAREDLVRAAEIAGAGWKLPEPLPLRDGEPLEVAWVCVPQSAGAGGFTTISRLACALESAGHRCTIYLPDRHGWSLEQHRRTMRAWWPALKAEIRDAAEPASPTRTRSLPPPGKPPIRS